MSVEIVGRVFVDRTIPLKNRFDALESLRNLGGKTAIDIIASGFADESALLKHEMAYCLGQMQDVYAIPKLIQVLEDRTQETIVRHEAGEALGAIGDPSALPILKRYSDDPDVEVAETCKLALGRLKWLTNESGDDVTLLPNSFQSIDPTPPAKMVDVSTLTEQLLSEQLPLFDRYRAMFALRNIGTKESVLALAKGLKCGSALFRHEVGFVLGQLAHDACIDQLAENLRDQSESPLVRHECADALGHIATDESLGILRGYLKDNDPTVRQSCIVALGLSEFDLTD